jgi:outer membrane protein assembly factor BamB
MSDPSIAIFISYARNEPDIAFVDRLEADLRVQGFRTWVDRSKLEGGQNWPDEIQKAIDRCQILLVVLSDEAAASDYVKNEYRYAQGQHKLVIPVQHRPISKIPLGLISLQNVDFQRNYAHGLKDLLAALRLVVPAPSVSPVQKETSQVGPLPLLRPTLAHPWINPPLATRLPGIIQIWLIVLVVLFVIGGGLGTFLAINGSIFKSSPTATPQGTVQTHSTATPQGTNTTTPTALGLKLAWTYTTKGHIEESSPVVANGMVYIGSLDHKLYALDAKTGAFRWAYTTGGPIRSSPAVSNGMVYVGSLDHNLYALDATSGAKQWSYSTGDGIYSSPVVANGILYFGSDDGNLYALDAASGTKKWLYSTSAQIVSTPAVANDMVYFGSEDDYFYALDAGSGSMKWSKNMGNAITSSPTVSLADNIVYIISWTGTLSAFDMVSGAKDWDQSAGGVGSTPTVANGVVYIGDNVSYVLYAIDSTSGAVQWNYPRFYTPPANGVTYQPSLPDAGITSSPAVANGVVYIGSADYNLYAIDTKSGNELASYATGGSILSSPLVANGMVYVGSSDNKLYAFHLPET